MSEILIGITGRYGTGKSTVAEMLAEMIPDARVVAFADMLKQQVHGVAANSIHRPLTAEEIEAHKGDVFGPLYQGWGQLMREFVDPDYWVTWLAERLPPRAIVADVRHHDEAEWIKSRGGLLVAISGPCRRPGDTRSTEHPSERYVPEIAKLAGWRIENGGSLPDLHAQAQRVAQAALERAGTVA